MPEARGYSEFKPAADWAGATGGGATRAQPAAGSALASSSDWVETTLLLGLIGGLAWAPFWLGGDRMTPWGANAVLFPGLALTYELSTILRGRRHAFAAKRIGVPLALFILVVLWIIAQGSPYVPSRFAHPIWSIAADALNAEIRGRISVDPALGQFALMRLLTDASVFWLALQLCRDAVRVHLLLQAVAAIVAAYAAYGLVLAAGFHGAIPFFDAPPSGGFVRSTFVNRNSFATYAGLGLVVVVALTFRLYRRSLPDGTGLASFRLTRLIEATGRRGAWLVGAGLAILAALLGAVSRGGVLSSALAVFAVLALIGARRRRPGEQFEAIIFVTVALVAAFVFLGDRIVGRIAASGLEDASRLSVDLIVGHAILDAPLIGFGYGGFAEVFPMYRDQSISTVGTWDMAHNTYLEVWLGLGLVAGAALMAALALLWVKCLVGAIKRNRNATAPIVAAAAGLLVGVHALVDFSLQIEAVTLTFMALLGAGVAQSESSRHAAWD